MSRLKYISFIVAVALLVWGGFALQQTLLEKQELLEQRTALERKLREAESVFDARKQTLFHTLTGRGAEIPVLSPSGFTAEMFERAWDNLGARGLAGTGEAIVAAEEKTGINGLVLAAIAYLESGGGGSRIAVDKNNLFGLGAYDTSPYSSALSFESREDSIFYAAHLLNRYYLSRDGRYYRGDDLRAIGKFYASDPRWAEKVAFTMILIVEAML